MILNKKLKRFTRTIRLLRSPLFAKTVLALSKRIKSTQLSTFTTTLSKGDYIGNWEIIGT